MEPCSSLARARRRRIIYRGDVRGGRGIRGRIQSPSWRPALTGSVMVLERGRCCLAEGEHQQLPAGSTA